MNYIYKVTLSAKNAKKVESFIAILSEAEANCLIDVKYYTKYNMSVKYLDINVSNESNYDDLVHWLKNTRLFKTEFRLIDTVVNKIRLPEGIVTYDAGLRISLGKCFTDYTHEDCVLENTLTKWVLSTFQTATYATSRNRFAISDFEVDVDDDVTIQYSHSFSTLGDKFFTVTERTYRKVVVEI